MPIFKHERSKSVHDWIGKRSIHGSCGHGFNNGLDAQIYGSVKCVRSWNPQQSVKHTNFGAIFNFDFSTEGSILVAACEKNSFLVFDPLNASLIGSKEKAHEDSVNCVKFLDTRMFATCSDDTTVRLWDIRSLKTNVMTLRGHTNWVKNIGYTNGMLITSGFDGHINMWDINKLSPTVSHPVPTPSHRISSTDVPACHRVFQMGGLMRCRISPDGSKLIIVSRCGYIMVIHDLNLETLMSDLRSLKPTLYHAMQVSRTCAAMAPETRRQLNQMFVARRNRVEFITDFPDQDEAEMIASMDVHPQGWSVVTRNSSRIESSEWTCVHDIQGTCDEVEWDDIQNIDSHFSSELEFHDLPQPEESNSSPSADAQSRSGSSTTSPTQPRGNQFLDMLRQWVSTSSIDNGAISSPLDIIVMPYFSRFRVDLMSELAAANGSEHGDADGDDTEQSDDDIDDNSNEITMNGHHVSDLPELDSHINSSSNNHISARSNHANRETSQCNSPSVDLNNETRTIRDLLLKNQRRLTHYVEEPNVGRGFIKEICYSGDGRLIASPFGHGVRLLSFDPDCREACDCRHDAPVQLHELASLITHSGVVVATKFCPTHTLLVSGCLAGKISFHQPLL